MYSQKSDILTSRAANIATNDTTGSTSTRMFQDVTKTSEIKQFPSSPISTSKESHIAPSLTRSKSEDPRIVSDTQEQLEQLNLEDKGDFHVTVKKESKTQVSPILPSPKPEFRNISQDFSSQQKQISTKQGPYSQKVVSP